jgi:hypothetical protein
MNEIYHRARELRERELAAAATDPAARQSHLKLAALHASKADREQPLNDRYQPTEAMLRSKREAAW